MRTAPASWLYGTAGLGRLLPMLVLLLTATTWVRAESEPVVFQSTETPPFWSPALPDHGFGGAMLKLLSANAGVSYSIAYLPVKRFRQSHGRYIVGDPDIIAGEKQRAILPIGLFSSAFFYYKPHHDVIEFHSLQDLRGHTLGVLRGTIEDREYFVRNGINIEESDSTESLLRKLKRGRVDICILVEAEGQHLIGQMFPDDRARFVSIEIAGTVRPIAIMIDVTDPQARRVAQRYQRVLDATLHSQKYRDILESFYGKGKVPQARMDYLQQFRQDYASDWDK